MTSKTIGIYALMTVIGLIAFLMIVLSIPESFSFEGTVVVHNCAVTDTGISTNTQAQLLDTKQELIAVSPLQLKYRDGPCHFWLRFVDVPPNQDLYGIKLGNRETLWYSKAELLNDLRIVVEA